MVSKKRTRRLEYKGNIFYWFVRRNQLGVLRIHILSADKKIHLEYPLIDSECIVTPKDVREHLEKYYGEEAEDGALS